MQIYISKNGTQNGPYSPEQVQLMLTQGYVTTNDLSWRHGFSEWQPLYMVLGLLPPVAPPPPSPSCAAPLRVRREKQDRPHVPIPVGGWLLFYGVSQVLISPVVRLWGMHGTWEDFQPFFAVYPLLRQALILENVVTSVFLLYGFAVGCAICGNDPKGREITKTFLVARFVAYLVMAIGLYWITSDLPPKLSSAFSGAIVWFIVRTAILFFAWWRYFTRSERVHLTYGPEPE